MGKKAITIIACEDTYKNLSTFNDIEELNKTVRYYKENFKTKLSKSTLAVLNQLHRYSAKYIGVSFRSKGHIAETLNISRRTVIRACQLLEQLGIIKQHELKRKSDNQQTSNAIQILPIVTQDKPENDSKCHTKTISISKTNNKNTLRTVESVRKNQTEFISSWVNKKFASFASNWFHPKEVNELWRISFIHGNTLELCSGDVLEVAIESIKVLVSKMKSRRIDNATGFYNGVIKRRMKTFWLHNLIKSVYESA